MAYDLTYELIDDNTHYEVSGYTGEPDNVVIPSTYDGKPVTSIGDRAFQHSDLTSITIPDGVTSIGQAAFSDCIRLTSIVIPDSVTSIGQGAFYFCGNLTSIVIPDSVTSIGQGAFSNCIRLTSITIPDSVTSIEQSAFKYCSSLTSITIPDSVEEIGSEAFYYCSNLTSVTIPDGVTSIGYNAFRGCSSLKEITLLSNEVPEVGSDIFTNINASAKFYCASNIIDNYEATTNWQPYISKFVVDDIRIWSIMYSKPINKKFDALTSKSLSQEFFDSLFPIN